MDVGTVVGIVVGFGLLLGSILMGGELAAFISIPSLLIVVGGTAAATLINFPIPDFMGVMKVVKNAFTNKASTPESTITTLISFAETARREGLLALEEQLKETTDTFLRAGMELAIDGMDLERIDSLMTMEVDLLTERHKRGQEMFKQMGKYAAAFGMMGTLIGLIQMLKNVNDPSAIGPGMAVALLTTFYGTLVANLICIPLAGKLESISQNEVLIKNLVLEGIKSIQSGDNPRLVEKKLKTFLPPAVREKLQPAEAK